MSHAIVAAAPGGPEVLAYRSVDTPRPGRNQLLVEVAAAGVNFIDSYEFSGTYDVAFPFTPGKEGAGSVAAVGPHDADAPRFAVGDRVAWGWGHSSYATHVVVDTATALPVPDGLDLATAAALPLQGITAHYLSHSSYKVTPGDTALVHAAAGGVGLLLTQMIKRRGGRVLATVSTPRKADLARAAGASEVINYLDEPVAQRVRELTGNQGVDVVYDGVGASTFPESLASLRPHGCLVLFGQSSGAVTPVDPARLKDAGSVYLTRPMLGHFISTRDELVSRAEDVFNATLDGDLKVHIGATYPLHDATRALTELLGRRTTGKILLQP
ncbi:quinone oxidoreductase family protein [Streptomyces sp. NPDC015492]|uniref:quinone oxidoreductase family protein n=1 Tax=Streptomyces sp. NPDC015492 TaxID=3364958 RepID=UPI0036FF89FD